MVHILSPQASKTAIDMIRLNCFFQASEGKYQEALEAAIALVACSQRDAGCLAYDVFESATRPDVFMICETWQNEESLSAHSSSQHFQEYVAKMQLCGTLAVEKMIR